MTPSKPLISTIIPTYRRPRLLGRAIRSVLAQTYPHLQVCVFDNASGDETPAVVRELAQADHRVQYHCHPENIGGIKNFVYGLAHVETPFFSILSDDDVLLPGMFHAALAGFDEFPEAMIAAAPTLLVDGGTRRVLRVPMLDWSSGLYAPPEGMLAMLREPHLPVWTGMVFRREVLEKTGNLDEQVGSAADVDFQVRIAAHFPMFVTLQPAAIHVIHPGAYHATATFEQKYAGWPNFIRKISADEAIPSDARRQATEMLNRYFKTCLSMSLASSIARAEWENADKTIAMLETQYQPTVGSSLLSFIARTARSIPPVHLLVRGVKALRQLMEPILSGPGAKQLQSSYGAYVRYLDS